MKSLREGNSVHSLRHVSDLLSKSKPTDFAKGPHLESVVERNDLENFLDNAIMSQRDFTAERGKIVVIGNVADTPEISIEDDVEEIYDYENIQIPRRPQWDESTTPEVLEADERSSFLEWRRNLARMEESSRMVITPFEKNLDVWRQLWRVIERSQVIVQIVDARNPLLFRCRDLESYVKEVDPSKKLLILINKADFLSPSMRKHWSDYFTTQNIPFFFCSAKREQMRLEALLKDEPFEISMEQDGDIPLVSTTELLQRFRSFVFPNSDIGTEITVGMCGYPNVGKSSMINALCGEKKVAVASMPGKTRHFQTHILGNIVLCDCPGLVFPTFMNSKSALVCNGILPIDRMREYISPVQWLCKRISREQLLSLYVLKDIKTPLDASEILQAHALLRGYMTSSGRPDEARSSRYILKDFVAGKLLYCHPPPHISEEERTAFCNSLSSTALSTEENPRNVEKVQEDIIIDELVREKNPQVKKNSKKMTRKEKARIKSHARIGMGEEDPKFRRSMGVTGYL